MVVSWGVSSLPRCLPSAAKANSRMLGLLFAAIVTAPGLDFLHQAVSLSPRQADHLRDLGRAHAVLDQHFDLGELHVLDLPRCPYRRVVANLEFGLEWLQRLADHAPALLDVNLEPSALDRLIVAWPPQANHGVEDIFTATGAALLAALIGMVDDYN